MKYEEEDEEEYEEDEESMNVCREYGCKNSSKWKSESEMTSYLYAKSQRVESIMTLYRKHTLVHGET